MTQFYFETDRMRKVDYPVLTVSPVNAMPIFVHGPCIHRTAKTEAGWKYELTRQAMRYLAGQSNELKPSVRQAGWLQLAASARFRRSTTEYGGVVYTDDKTLGDP